MLNVCTRVPSDASSLSTSAKMSEMLNLPSQQTAYQWLECLGSDGDTLRTEVRERVWSMVRDFAKNSTNCRRSVLNMSWWTGK